MIFLDDQERAKLKIQHKKERDGRVRDRIKAVLLHDRGWSPQQSARNEELAPKTWVEVEHSYNVIFRGKIIGRYIADLVVNDTVIVELKCCGNLISEHQAQLFNYLKVSGLPVGLLVNFRRRKLDWKRLQSNEDDSNIQKAVESA